MDQGQHRRERITLETERHRISGELTLPRDGYRSRVSDLLNATEREFVSLTDVTVERFGSDDGPQHHPFLAISRRHIVLFVAPE